jgi:hypothetical protein
VGLLHLPRWARGPLSVPYRSGTLAYRLKSKTRSKTYCHVSHSTRSRLPTWEGSNAATCPAAPDPAPCLRGLRRCHVPRGSGPRLPAREGSNVAMCPVDSDPASLLRRVLALPCAPWLRTPPPCSEGFGAATCPAAQDPASLLERAPTLSRAPRLWISLPYSGGFWHCHVSRGSGPHLPAREGSDAAICPAALSGP